MRNLYPALLLLFGCPGQAGTTTVCFMAADGDPLALHSLALGYVHGCGLRDDGTVACWGAGGPYQARGMSFGQAAPPTGAFISLSSGDSGTCGLRADGTIECWGAVPAPSGSSFSKLAVGSSFGCGIDATTASISCWGEYAPPNPPAGRFVDLGVGSGHGCALSEAGTIACWGSNDEGQTSPPAGTFERIIVDSSAACALDAAGTITCWGSSYLGPPPQSSFSSMALSVAHACAIATDGHLVCWGNVEVLGSARYDSPPAGTFTEVAVASEFSCARRTDGELVCWGKGETGVPCTQDDQDCGQAIPPRETIEVCASMPALVPETAVSAGAANTCRIDDSGEVTCWGAGITAEGCGRSECGGGDVCHQIIECGQSNAPDGDFARLALGPIATCALRSDGTPECWGSELPDYPGPLPSGPFSSLPDWSAHGCGIRPNGMLHCWGDNYSGQAWPPPGRFLEVAPGAEHTCAIREDGVILCWGLLYEPDPIPTGNFSHLGSGDSFSCAMSDDGRVHCWNLHSAHRSHQAPDVEFAQYDVGDRHACGVRADDGTVLCWPDLTFSNPAKTLPPAGAFRMVSAGGEHTCGLTESDDLECWGDNAFGQSVPP